MGLFTRRLPPVDTSGLGSTLIAQGLAQGDVVPPAVTLVVFNPAGHARRMAGGRVVCHEGDIAYGFHPGPYSVDLLPFVAAPEIGLRLRFAIDTANPRVAQQRFDLYLFSEAGPQLALATMRLALQATVQDALAQGALELPPCTSLDEWNAFRAGLNQLLYTRVGLTVDDCVPVDLGDLVDYAALLRQRAEEQSSAVGSAAALADDARNSGAVPQAQGSPQYQPQTPQPSDTPSQPLLSQSATPQPQSPGERDARALRRLFLELPALSTAMRVLPLPAGLPMFQSQQNVLQRLSLVALSVGTMPTLAWAAPDQPLEPDQQQRRSEHAVAAVTALDECWSLLARLQLADDASWPLLLDEADRLCANLEFHLAQRRLAIASIEVRKEPVL